MNTLYLIPTPPGDPDDMTLRALRILGEVRAIATPDPAATSALLAHHQVSAPPLIPLAAVITALASGDVALIGVGDVPAIADPAAAEIVRDALATGARVEPLPGVSVPISALVLSAMPPDAFIYLGRVSALAVAGYARERATLVLTLPADSIAQSLTGLHTLLGDRPACLVYQLGAPNGKVWRDRLDALAERLVTESLNGEIALVIGGAPPDAERIWEEDDILKALHQRLEDGESLKVVAKALAAVSGWDRRSIYALGIEDKSNEDEEER